ncbi:MAG: glycosyltransferase family 2 protein [Limisphaerales bacterium]
MAHPSISVVIPVHNMARYLYRAVVSAFWQLEPDDAIIVVDDGSTDLADYDDLRSFGDRVTWLRNPTRRGVSFSRNRAIQSARGDWIKFLDADDVLAPFAFDCIRAPEPGIPDEVKVLTGGCDRIGDRGYVDFWTKADKSPDYIMHLNPLLLSASFVRREALLTVGLFDERIEFEEDWDLWLRLHERYGPGCFRSSKQPVCYYWFAPADERNVKIRSPNVEGIPVREYFRRRYGAEPW